MTIVYLIDYAVLHALPIFLLFILTIKLTGYPVKSYFHSNSAIDNAGIKDPGQETPLFNQRRLCQILNEKPP